MSLLIQEMKILISYRFAGCRKSSWSGFKGRLWNQIAFSPKSASNFHAFHSKVLSKCWNLYKSQLSKQFFNQQVIPECLLGKSVQRGGQLKEHVCVAHIWWTMERVKLRINWFLSEYGFNTKWSSGICRA